MADRLTDAMVRKALPPMRGQTMVWDGEVKGFALRVTPGGAKAFVLDYRAEGRQRRITLGQYPDWSVQAARKTAKELKREVDHGRDPMGERHAERIAPTMQELWRRYELEHLPRKAFRSQADERIMWGKIILPRFGKMKVAAIIADDIDSLHHDITTVRRTPIRANRTVEVLRKAFNLAIRWNWREDNPASGVRKNPEEKNATGTSIETKSRCSPERSKITKNPPLRTRSSCSCSPALAAAKCSAPPGTCSIWRMAFGPNRARTRNSAGCIAYR
jgi:hypothetical protein